MNTLHQLVRQLFSAALLALMAMSQVEAAPKRVALLIGNWDYNLNGRFDADPAPNHLPDLRNPCRDASLVRKSLDQAKFEITEACNLNRSEFDQRIKAFAKELNELPKGSVVFVYISGHGFQFRGHTFTAPVLYHPEQQKLSKGDDRTRLAHFLSNAYSVANLIQSLPDSFDIPVVIALDECRDSPITSDTYNELVSITVPPNVLIQYATTPGDRTADGAGRNSDYAMALASQLARGGDIGDVMARVGSQIWKAFTDGKRTVYADTHPGAAFFKLGFTPLAVGEQAHIGPPLLAASKGKEVVRNIYDGISLDILWCDGAGGEERHRFAMHLATDVSARAKEFGVGRIQIKPLTVQTNFSEGYNVRRNLMRFDPNDPVEKALLIRLVAAYPEGNFLPKVGVGMRGKPTPNYVSVFVCGRVGG